MSLIPGLFSSVAGVVVPQYALVDAWCYAPERVDLTYIGGDPLDRYWTNPGRTRYTLDRGQECPFDGGLHEWFGQGNGIGAVKKTGVGDVMWIRVNYHNTHETIAWAGPCDWDLSGWVGNPDLTGFIESFVMGEADWNWDGVTNSQDFVDFIEAYLLIVPGDPPPMPPLPPPN